MEGIACNEAYSFCMPITGKTNIPNINSFYDRVLLLRAQPLLVHAQFGQLRDIPMHNSDTIKFRRYGDLPVATTPLTEGVTPTGSSLSQTTLTATISDYGDYVTISDKLDRESEDQWRAETARIQGDQAGKTFDTLCRDVLVTGTNVIFPAGRTARNQIIAGDVLTEAMIIAPEELLKLNNAYYFTEFMDARNLFNTTPLPPSYIGIVHTNITRTLRAMSGFTRVQSYADASGRMLGEVGSIQTTRFIETTQAKIFVGAGAGPGFVDVYATLILGQEAYGITHISGDALQVITQDPGGNSDPLLQRMSMGWKRSFTTKILNDAFLVRLEHAGV